MKLTRIAGNNGGMLTYRALGFLLAAALAPAMLFAGPFDGLYKPSTTADCTAVGPDGGAIRIEKNIFYGAEVQCRMTNPVDIVNMDATLYEMQCLGEDQAWTERAMLMTDAEQPGIYMIWNGYAFRYQRCEASGS